MATILTEEYIPTGLRKERIEGLHDGIYAVALTLLVLDVHVPHAASTFGQFVRLLNGEFPEIASAAMAFSIVGLMWLNNFYGSSLFVRVDLTHLVLMLAAAGAIVFVPFSTRALAEYWVHPWGIALFSWNLCLAVVFYAIAAHHYVRFLVPKQVDRKFLHQRLVFMWVFAILTGIFVPLLALVNPTAALVSIPIVMLGNIVSTLRMQPSFIGANRVVALHAEDDLRL